MTFIITKPMASREREKRGSRSWRGVNDTELIQRGRVYSHRGDGPCSRRGVNDTELIQRGEGLFTENDTELIQRGRVYSQWGDGPRSRRGAGAECVSKAVVFL